MHYFYVEVKFTYYKIYHLTILDCVVKGISYIPDVVNHHCLVPERSHHPQRKPFPALPVPAP